MDGSSSCRYYVFDVYAVTIRKMRKNRRRHPKGVKFAFCKCSLLLSFRVSMAGRMWTRPYNTENNRLEHSWYHTLMQEAAIADHYTFFNFTRLTPMLFNELELLLGNAGYGKKDTNMRRCISLGKALCLLQRIINICIAFVVFR